MAESKHFETTLGREDDDEENVEVVQYVGQDLGRLVLIQRHGQHIQSDEQHDDHVKLFIGDDLKDDRLWTPLLMSHESRFCLSKNNIESGLVRTWGLGMALRGFFDPIFFMAL